MNMKTSNFETSDISLCATLHTLGFTLDFVDRTHPSKAVFVFSRKEGLDEAIQRYWAHSLLVDPLAYFSSLKEVKDRLYQHY